MSSKETGSAWQTLNSLMPSLHTTPPLNPPLTPPLSRPFPPPLGLPTPQAWESLHQQPRQLLALPPPPPVPPRNPHTHPTRARHRRTKIQTPPLTSPLPRPLPPPLGRPTPQAWETLHQQLPQPLSLPPPLPLPPPNPASCQTSAPCMPGHPRRRHTPRPPLLVPRRRETKEESALPLLLGPRASLRPT